MLGFLSEDNDGITTRRSTTASLERSSDNNRKRLRIEFLFVNHPILRQKNTRLSGKNFRTSLFYRTRSCPPTLTNPTPTQGFHTVHELNSWGELSTSGVCKPPTYPSSKASSKSFEVIPRFFRAAAGCFGCAIHPSTRSPTPSGSLTAPWL